MNTLTKEEWEDISERLDRMAEDCDQIVTLIADDTNPGAAAMLGRVKAIHAAVSEALTHAGQQEEKA